MAYLFLLRLWVWQGFDKSSISWVYAICQIVTLVIGIAIDRELDFRHITFGQACKNWGPVEDIDVVEGTRKTKKGMPNPKVLRSYSLQNNGWSTTFTSKLPMMSSWA